MATNVFKIRTKDSGKRITGTAKKSDGSNYNIDTDLKKIEIKIQKPNNGTTFPPVTASTTTPGGADFHYDISGEFFDVEGYWGFQATFYPVGGTPIDSEIEFIWVGPSLVESSQETLLLEDGGNLVLE